MILITGAAGLIGSALAHDFEKEGKDLLLCDLFSNADKWNRVKNLKNAAFVHFDDLKEALRFYSPKIIFHMAAYTVPTESDFSGFIKNNIGFSRFLLDYSLSNNADFFYASSSATYGDGRLGFSDLLSIDQLLTLDLKNPYAWSKQRFDFEAHRFIGSSKNRIVGFKFFNTYGDFEYHKLKTDSASVPFRFKQSILKNEDVVILTDPLKRHEKGHQMRDFNSVDLAVDMVKKVAFKSDFNGLMNIGSGEPIKFIDLFERLKKEVPTSTSKIIFKDMTIEQAEQYQFYTCAKLDNFSNLK